MRLTPCWSATSTADFQSDFGNSLTRRTFLSPGSEPLFKTGQGCWHFRTLAICAWAVLQFQMDNNHAEHIPARRSGTLTESTRICGQCAPSCSRRC